MADTEHPNGNDPTRDGASPENDDGMPEDSRPLAKWERVFCEIGERALRDKSRFGRRRQLNVRPISMFPDPPPFPISRRHVSPLQHNPSPESDANSEISDQIGEPGDNDPVLVIRHVDSYGSEFCDSDPLQSLELAQIPSVEVRSWHQVIPSERELDAEHILFERVLRVRFQDAARAIYNIAKDRSPPIMRLYSTIEQRDGRRRDIGLTVAALRREAVGLGFGEETGLREISEEARRLVRQLEVFLYRPLQTW